MYILCHLQASGFWSPAVKGSSFPHVPCDSLCNEAKLSMLFASLNHSSISDPTEPDVIFGQVSRFKGSEGRIVCSPEVANFYTAAGMLNGMQYVAALGVGLYFLHMLVYTYAEIVSPSTLLRKQDTLFYY